MNRIDRTKTNGDVLKELQEQQKEKRTKQLFKTLHKDYDKILLDKVTTIWNNLPTKTKQNDWSVFQLMIESNKDVVIDDLIQELKEQYYNDNNYYCNKQEFHNLKLYYLLNYDKAIKKVLKALR